MTSLAADQLEKIYSKSYMEKVKEFDGIKVEVHPYLNKVPSRGIKTDLPVLFNIVTGNIPEKKNRDPLNLCLVLDRSGSMNGKWIEECKRGISMLYGKLYENDLVHLVVYDNQVDVIFECKQLKDLNEMKSLTESIVTRGATNISDALKAGIDILNKYEEAKYKKALFLFSDGEANDGIQDVDELGKIVNQWHEKHDVFFTAFGISTNYNEKLMRGIARCGKGSYFYLDDPEKTLGVINKALNSVTSDMATNAILKVRGCGVNNFVKKLMFLDDMKTLIDGKRIGDLNEHNVVQILSHIEYTPSEPGKTFDVLEYELTFDKLDSIDLDQVSPIKGTLQIESTCDFSEIEYNTEVEAYMAIHDGAEMEVKVSEFIHNGDFDNAVATKEKIVSLYRQNLAKGFYPIVDMMWAKANSALEAMKKEGLSSNVVKKQNFYGQMACAAGGVSQQKYSNVSGGNFKGMDEEECDALEGGCDMFGGCDGDY